MLVRTMIAQLIFEPDCVILEFGKVRFIAKLGVFDFKKLCNNICSKDSAIKEFIFCRSKLENYRKIFTMKELEEIYKQSRNFR